MSEKESFVVSDPKGTLVQRYKWLWEQQRAEFVLLQQQHDALLQQLRSVQADSKVAHHQLDMTQRERNVYAGALLNAHKAVARYEVVLSQFAAKKSALQ